MSLIRCFLMWSSLALIAALAGCSVETWRLADLQVDIDAPLPATAEWVHICVAGVGEHLEGAANGRVAMPALPFADAHEITVEVWADDEDPELALVGTTGPLTLTLTEPYLAVPLQLGTSAPCTAEGEVAPKDSASWLLVARFLGEEVEGVLATP